MALNLMKSPFFIIGCTAIVLAIIAVIFLPQVFLIIVIPLIIVCLLWYFYKYINKLASVNEQKTQLEQKNRVLRKNFEKIIPEDMAASIINDPDKLDVGGETRQITVIQSDIRGFSEMIQPMTASNAIDMLNHYLETMTMIIRRFGGTVLEFQGDGILAIFDSAKLGGKYADKAVFAAVVMQNSMEDINLWNRERNYPVFEMGIGIHSGPAFVGWIGSDERMKYDALGTTINIASRIESYSTGGQIIVSDSFMNTAEVKLEVANKYEVLPKGSYEKMVLYCIKGIGKPYNLHCRLADEIPKKLEIPKMIRFRIVENKQCGEPEYAGLIVSASSTSAMMITNCPLKLFDNLRVESDGVFSAKVVSRSENGYMIRFTSGSLKGINEAI